MTSSYESKTDEELSEELKNRGLPFTGVKAELITRLESDDSKSDPVIHDDNIDRDNDINDAPEAIRTDLKGDPTTTTPRSEGDVKDPPTPKLPQDSDGENTKRAVGEKYEDKSFHELRHTPEFRDMAYARPNVLFSQTGQVDTGTGGYVDHGDSVSVNNGIVPDTVVIDGDHMVIPKDLHDEPTTPYIILQPDGSGKLVTPKDPPASPLQPQAQAYGESQVATPVVPVSRVPTAQPEPAIESVKANTVAMDTQVTHQIVLDQEVDEDAPKVVYGSHGLIEDLDGPVAGRERPVGRNELVVDQQGKKVPEKKAGSSDLPKKDAAKKDEPKKPEEKKPEEKKPVEAPKTQSEPVKPVEAPKTQVQTPPKAQPEGSIKEAEGSDKKGEGTKVEGTFIGAIKENETNE